jgi:hypothetical protein
MAASHGKFNGEPSVPQDGGMKSKRKMVSIECPNPDCRAHFDALLADAPPELNQVCVECDTPFGTMQGLHVYAVFPPSN